MSKKIIIDPGHAPGNVNGGKNGYKEYAGMWTISNYLKAALERCGCTVAFTRTENEDPALSARGRKATGYDLFISEHSNAASGTARGVEVYYSLKIPGDKSFAAALSKQVAALMGNSDRGAKTRESTTTKGADYYTVIFEAQKAGAARVLLIENGFHDNTNDEAFLLKNENLKAIAETQAKVICTYLGCAYKEDGITPPFTDTKIMGTATATAAQMAAYLISKNPSTEPYAREYADLYISEGITEGVRGDIAFAQMCHETGYLKYGNDVKREQYNFAGMGATGNGAPGLSFACPQEGIRAHVQHLKAYACTEPLKLALVQPLNGDKPRFDYVNPRGCAEYVEWLGIKENPGGKGWAADTGYGSKVLSVLGGILDTVADERTPEGITVDNLIADGVITDRVHWLGVLIGTIKPNPEYIKIAFDRYHQKVSK